MVKSQQLSQRMMLQHYELTQRLVTNQPQAIHVRTRGLSPELKIRPYTENEHAAEFLQTF